MASQWLEAPTTAQHTAICKDLEFTRVYWDRRATIDETILRGYKHSLNEAENYHALRKILDAKSYRTGYAQGQAVASRAMTQGCRFVILPKKGADMYHEEGESTSSGGKAAGKSAFSPGPSKGKGKGGGKEGKGKGKGKEGKGKDKGKGKGKSKMEPEWATRGWDFMKMHNSSKIRFVAHDDSQMWIHAPGEQAKLVPGAKGMFVLSTASLKEQLFQKAKLEDFLEHEDACGVLIPVAKDETYVNHNGHFHHLVNAEKVDVVLTTGAGKDIAVYAWLLNLSKNKIKVKDAQPALNLKITEETELTLIIRQGHGAEGLFEEASKEPKKQLSGVLKHLLGGDDNFKVPECHNAFLHKNRSTNIQRHQ